MSRQIAAIVVIFICAAVAWSVLGTTIFSRTYSFDDIMRGRVASIWGAPHVQKSPMATTTKEVIKKVETNENNKTVMRVVKEKVATPISLEGSRVKAALDLEHRQKGLLWYSTYKVDLAGGIYFQEYHRRRVRDIYPTVSNGSGSL